MARDLLRIGQALFCVSGAVLTGLAPGIAQAQQATSDPQSAPSEAKTQADGTENTGLGEIVVTAERRTSALQRTPIAITAISGSDLANKGISSVESFRGQIPGVAVNNESGVVKVNIRGLGLNAYGPATEGNVAVYTGGVYLAHPPEIGAAFLDVQRVEVLRGPQGTLYGRNSTGGAMNIIPNSPTNTFKAGMTASYGNYNDVGLTAFVSGPVMPDVLKVRVAGQYQRHDGYSLNVPNGDRYDGLDQGGVRAILEYTPDSKLKVSLSADYFHGDDTSVLAHYLGDGIQRRYAQQLVSKALDPIAAAAAVNTIPVDRRPLGFLRGGATNPIDSSGRVIDPQNLYFDTAPVSTRTYYGFGGTLEYQISDEVSVKSITAYRKGEYSNLYDLDRSTVYVANYTQIEKYRQISEEVQLLGETGNLNWLIGGYYLNDKIPFAGYIYTTPQDGGTYLPYGAARTTAYAAFGQATYAFTPKLKLTVGGRFSYEKRSRAEFVDAYGTVTGPLLPDRGTYQKFTPKATLQYEPSANVSLYATVAQGFKSGGFLITAAQDPVLPESLWDYEVGAKLRLADNRVQINAAGYHYDYTNIQVPFVGVLTSGISNAASATINGGEIEITAQPVPALRLSGSVTYIDGTFNEFQSIYPQYAALGLLDLKGNRLPFNSKLSYYVDAIYKIDLANGAAIEAQGSYTWRGKKYFDAFNLENNYQPSVGTVDARLRYTMTGGSSYIEAFGRNLTDEFIVSQSYVSGVFLGSPIGAQREPPRTYGIRIGFNY